MGMTPERLYTIGHSNRGPDDFVAVLTAAGIRTVVDIRAQPHSARHPHFDQESLRDALTAADIQYHWAGRPLGGQRTPRADSPHTALASEGLRGYADLMDGEPFRKAVAQLLGLARRAPTAVLCAERDPLQCHRSLLSDYLILHGVEVMHLVDVGDTRAHQLRPEARRESLQLIYDRHTTAALPLGD